LAEESVKTSFTPVKPPSDILQDGTNSGLLVLVVVQGAKHRCREKAMRMKDVFPRQCTVSVSP
jgi:hypothetical protein